MKNQLYRLANVADLLTAGEELRIVLGTTLPDEAGLANIAATSDGWALIAKYGDHPHPGMPGKVVPVIQRFDRRAADEIVANFKSTWGRIKRAVVGLPIFDGHPDVPGLERVFKDKETKGTYADLRADEDGMYGRPVLTSNGARAVETGHDRQSPYWWCRATGETASDGTPIVSPFKLLSVGLVDRANIPGPSLMNMAEASAATVNPNQSDMNKERDLLIQLLAALGTTVPATAGDTDLANAVQTAISGIKTESTSKAANAAVLAVLKTNKLDTPEKLSELLAQGTTLANAKTTAETAKTSAETALANAKAELDAAKSATAAERKAHAMTLANAAVTAGIIKPGERDQWVTDLCNGDIPAFNEKAKELAKKKPADKVESTAMKLGNQRQASTVGDQKWQKIHDGVNALMKANGLTYEVAYANFAANPENAKLFEGMQGPEIKLPNNRR